MSFSKRKNQREISKKRKYKRKDKVKKRLSPRKKRLPPKILPIEVFSGYLGIFEVLGRESLRK